MKYVSAFLLLTSLGFLISWATFWTPHNSSAAFMVIWGCFTMGSFGLVIGDL